MPCDEQSQTSGCLWHVHMPLFISHPFVVNEVADEVVRAALQLQQEGAAHTYPTRPRRQTNLSCDVGHPTGGTANEGRVQSPPAESRDKRCNQNLGPPPRALANGRLGFPFDFLGGAPGVVLVAGACQRHGVGGFLLRNTTPAARNSPWDRRKRGGLVFLALTAGSMRGSSAR